MLRIGDFSKLSQVSVKALRFYDEIGLLEPSYVDRITGYRYYATNLLSRLNRILFFKDLGFSLDEIALLMRENLPSAEVHKALQSRRSELSSRIALDQSRLAQVDNWLRQLEHAGSIPEFEIRIRQIPARLVASVRAKVGSYEEAEDLFTEVDRHLAAHRAGGQRAAIWHTCAGKGGRIDCEAIALLDTPIPDSKRVRVYEIPGITGATIIHQGSDETIETAYAAVRSWIRANGYTISGPNRETYWQGGVAGNDGFGLTEIQYPILKEAAANSISAGSVGH